MKINLPVIMLVYSFDPEALCVNILYMQILVSNAKLLLVTIEPVLLTIFS